MAEAGGSRSDRIRKASYNRNDQRKQLGRVVEVDSPEMLEKKRKAASVLKASLAKKSLTIPATRIVTSTSSSVVRPTMPKKLTRPLIPLVLQKRQEDEIAQKSLIPPIPPEIWEEITAYCDLASLRSLRVCCKMLYAVVNRTIYYRDESFIVNFKYDKDKKKCFFTKQVILQTGSSFIKRRESLQELITLIESSPSFPCHGIKLCGGTLDSTEEMPKFFQQQGKIIRRLWVEFCRRRSRGKNIHTNLYIDGHQRFLDFLRQSPNLEHLELSLNDDILEYNENSTITYKIVPFHLPLLKSFKILNFDIVSINIIEAILSAAPNLERFENTIRGLRADYVNALIKTDKIHTIKHLHVQPDAVMYELHIRLTSLGPKLESVTFNTWNISILPHLFDGVSSVISKLLESSKDTLKKIVLETPMGFLPNLHWPELKKVRHIRIDMNKILFNDPTRRPLASKYLPEDLDWSKVFPFLHELTIDFTSGPTYPIESLPIFGNATSVQRLDIPCIIPFSSNRCPQSIFEELPVFFPNLSHLSVRVTREDFSKILRIVWTNYPMLMSFSVRFVKTVGLWIRSHIDAVITGFSESVCIKLKDGEPFEELEKLRSNSSILNLKGLKELAILFDTDESWTELSHHDRLFTEVSVWHAFQLIPDLRAKILVQSRDAQKVEKSLKSIASHIPVQVNTP